MTRALPNALDMLDSLPTLVRDTRQARGLSYRQVEAATGVPYTVVRNVECNLVDPRSSTASALLRWIMT